MTTLSKGRVERGIRYVRSSFWGARKWKDLNDLNEQARLWCLGEADERRWVQDERICVKEAFLKECELMHPLVETAYPVYDRREVHVGKSQYVQFDCNFYSVPGEFARRTLSVFATEEIVRILDGMNVVAEHKRSFEKQKQIDDEKHIGDLIDAKRAARKHHGLSQLQSAAPSTTDFFVEAGNRGQNLGRLTQELLLLLKLYGSSELEHGIKSAFNAGRIHASAVRHAIQHERGKRGQQMEPVKLQFESNQLANELTIVPNSLEGYGKLFEDKEADL